MNAADIAAVIRRDIGEGALQCHDRLPSERDLAATYGVARNTLREALHRLSREGFVEVRPGSGTYVTYNAETVTAAAIESANPLELIDARFALEPHICRLCVLHGRRDDFDRLEALCREMETCLNDPNRFSEADTAFHKQLAAATGNGLLMWIIGQINTVRSHDEWTRMRRVTLEPEIISEYNAQHRAILNAIRDRAPEDASVRMKAHLATARTSLTQVAET